MKILLLVIFFVLLCGRAVAQEVQVPFDSAGTIQVINQDLEKKLDLFTAYPHFEEARLFQEPDSSYSVEITSDSSGRTLRGHLRWSLSDKRDAERRIRNMLFESRSENGLDQEGRTSLLISSVVLSLAGYGTLIPVAFNMTNAEQIAGTDLLMAGGSFLLASTLTAHEEVTDNEASLAATGGVLGLGHGWLLTFLIGGVNANYHTAAGISTVTSIGEFLGGYYIARNLRMTGGTASVIGMGGLFGAFDGFGLSIAVLPSNPPNSAVSLMTGLSLAGSVGGYYAGYLLAMDHPYSDGDATVLWLGATLGGVIPLVNLLEANVNDHVTLPLLSIAGSIAATAALHQATRSTNFTSSQAFNIVLATTAGGLALAGISLIAKGSEQTSVALASIGAVGGFCLAFATTHTTQRVSKTTGSLNIQLNPTALLASHVARPVPLAGLSYTF